MYAPPVHCRALFEQRKTAKAPRSYGRLKVPEGCFSSINILEAYSILVLFAFALIYICFSINGVKTKPGQIALQVIPVLAFSRATALVKPITPCLAAT